MGIKGKSAYCKWLIRTHCTIVRFAFMCRELDSADPTTLRCIRATRGCASYTSGTIFQAANLNLLLLFQRSLTS